MNVSIRNLSVSLVFLYAPTVVALDAYTLVDLGGSGNSFAWSVNEQGDVVGSTANTTTGGEIPDGVPFVYSDGVLTELATFGGPGVAFDVNNVGQVVGYAVDANGVDQAVIWENGAVLELGASQGSYSRAHAVNDAGQIVGIFADQSGDEHGFLYDNGSITDLGILGATPWPEYPYIDINELGVVAYLSNDNSSGMAQARLYDSGTIIELGTPVDQYSMAVSINDSGLAVGSMDDSTTIFADVSLGQAVLFDNGSIVELAAPANALSFFGVVASGVNDHGQVVGGATGAAILDPFSISARGILYEQSAGTVDINDLLVGVETSDETRTNVEDWMVVWGEKINNSGMIAANAWFNTAESTAVLLMPVVTNNAPVADAGRNQRLTTPNTSAQLNGRRSFDEDGDEITYQWSFVSKPSTSQAVLSDVGSERPSFVVDVPGRYDIQLIVTDSQGAQSAPDAVLVTLSRQ